MIQPQRFSLDSTQVSGGNQMLDEKPFRLAKSFSLIAVVMIFAVVLVLVTVISRQAEIIITKRVEDDTIKLMENLNHQMYTNFLTKVSDPDGRSRLREPEQQALLHDIITNTIYGFDLKSVFIYGPGGEVVYATDETELLTPAKDMEAFNESINLFKSLPRIKYVLPQLFRLTSPWEGGKPWTGHTPAQPVTNPTLTDPLPTLAPSLPSLGGSAQYRMPNLYYYALENVPSNNEQLGSGEIPEAAEVASETPTLTFLGGESSEDDYLSYQRSQTVFRYDRGGYLLFNILPKGEFVLRSYKAMGDLNPSRYGVSGVLEISRDLTPEYHQLARLQYFAFGIAVLLTLGLTFVLRWVVSRGEAIITRRNEQKRTLEQRLDQAERLAGLGSMVATVAHEIRNPLGIIHSTADVLKRYLSPHPDQARLARAIIEEANRLSEVVTEFLDFARPPMPRLEPVLIEDILEEILAFMEITLARAGVEVRTSFRQNPTPIPGDKAMLHRAFLNLLVNAIQAMDDGGLITVVTQVGNNSSSGKAQLLIAISDTGPGLSEEVHQKIFSPFYTTKAKGTGLGLVIVRNIIESHGGQIELNDTAADYPAFEGAGVGLTASIRLNMV